jgi:archaellum component FlaC
MTIPSAYVLETPKIVKREELDAATGAGAQPQYIHSDVTLMPCDDLNGSDEVALNSASLHTESTTAVKQSAPVEQEEGVQYVENTGKYQDFFINFNELKEVVAQLKVKAQDAPPPPPPPAPEGTEESSGTGETENSGGTGNAGGTDSAQGSGSSGGVDGDYSPEDAFGGIDDAFNDLFDNYDESDFINEGGDGEYDELNEEALKAFTEKVLRLLNMLMGLAIAMSIKQDINDAIDEIFSGQALEKDGKAGLRAGVLKLFSGIMKTTQQGMGKLLELVNAHNQEVFNHKVEDAKEESGSTKFKVENWWEGGYPAQELNRDLAQEQEKYLEALKSSSQVFKTLINLMIELMTEGLDQLPKDSELGDLMMASATGLKRLVAKMDEFNATIDEKLEEVRKQIDDMQSIDNCEAGWDKMWSGGWDNFWGGLQGCFRAFQNVFDKIPGLNIITHLVTEPFQMVFSLVRDPIEFILTIVENILDVVATALNYIGEFIDKLTWIFTGWATDNENWTSGDGWSNTWTDWSGDDSYGTHGVGDVLQWVGRVIVDDILDNIIVDNICDGIRYVLYEGISWVINQIEKVLGKDVTTAMMMIIGAAFGGIGGAMMGGMLEGMDDPGEHDYFGMEIDLTGGAGGNYNGQNDMIAQGAVAGAATGGGAVVGAGLGAGFGYGINALDGASYSTGGKVLKGDHTSSYDPTDVADLNIDVLVREIRGGIIRGQNAFRVAIAISLLKAELRNIVFREVTGLNGVAGNAELIAAAADLLVGPATMIADAAVSNMMTRASIYNTMLQTIESFDKLDKAKAALAAGVLLTVVALVIAIIMIAYSAGSGTVPAALIVAAAFTSAAAAASNMAAQNILADIQTFDVDKPVAPVTDDVEMADGRGSVSDVLNGIDQEIAAMESALAKGEGFMVTTKDGMMYLDSKAIANFERQMNALNNGIRAMFYLLKQKQDLRRLIKAILGGNAGSSASEGLTLKSMESLLAQRQAVVSAITFQMSQYIAAKNMVTQKNTALGKVNEGAAGQCIGATASCVLACIPVVGGVTSAVVNLCVSIASAAVSIAVALSNEKLNMTYASNDEQLDAFLENRAGNDNSFESKLDRMEAEAMLEFLQNGLIGTGDGYHGVNGSQLAQTLHKLQQIFQLKQVLSDAMTLGAKVRAAVMRELTGVSPGTAAEEMTKAVNQANFTTALRVMSNLSTHMKTVASVMNQARDAEKAMIMSCVMGAINIVASAVSFVGIGAEVGTAASAVGKLASPVGSVLSSLSNVIIASLSATSDNGELEGYDVNDVVDDMEGKKTNNKKAGDWQTRLDEREEEIMREMATSMINSMDSSLLGVSADTSLINSKMNKLYNMKLAIAMAMQVMRDIKAAMGKFQSSSSLTEIIEANRSASMSILEALQGSLESIVERENQKTQSTMQAVQASITLAISLAQLGCTAGKVSNEQKIVAEMTKTAPDQTNVDTWKDQNKAIDRSVACLGLLNKVANAIVPACFDQYAKDNPTESKDVSVKTDHPDRKGKKGKSEGKEGGYAESLDRMDDQLAAHQYGLAKYQLSAALRAYQSGNAENALGFFKALPMDIVNTVDAFLNKTKAVAEEAAMERAAGVLNNNPLAAVHMSQAVAGQQPDQHATQSSKVLLESAKELIRQIEATTTETTQAIERTNREIAALESQASTALPASREQIQARISELKQLLTQKQQLLVELADRKKAMDAVIAMASDESKPSSIVAQEAVLTLELTGTAEDPAEGLRPQLSAVEDQIGQLQAEIGDQEPTAQQETRMNTLLAKRAEIKAQIVLVEQEIQVVRDQALGIRNDVQAVANQIAAVREEVKGIGREINSLQRQLNQTAEGEEGGLVSPAASTMAEATGVQTANTEAIDESAALSNAASNEQDTVELFNAGELVARLALHNKDANLGATLLMVQAPQLTHEQVTAAIIELGTSDPTKAGLIRDLVNTRFHGFLTTEDRQAINERLAPPATAATPAQPAQTPVVANRQPAAQSTTVQAYDSWIAAMQIGAEQLANTAEGLTDSVLTKAVAIENSITAALREGERPLSKQELIAHLRLRESALTTERDSAVARQREMRETIIPAAKTRAEEVVASAGRQMTQITAKKAEIAQLITELEGLETSGTITAEQKTELAGLRQQATKMTELFNQFRDVQLIAQQELVDMRLEMDKIATQITKLTSEIVDTGRALVAARQLPDTELAADDDDDSDEPQPSALPDGQTTSTEPEEIVAVSQLGQQYQQSQHANPQSAYDLYQQAQEDESRLVGAGRTFSA